jgi:hypothetical protein
MPDAAARARLWGQLARTAAAATSPPCAPAAALLDPPGGAGAAAATDPAAAAAAFYVERVRGLRVLPADPAAGSSGLSVGAGVCGGGTEGTYLLLERGGLVVWARPSRRLRPLMALAAAFLAAAAGAVARWLPPEAREGLLRRAGLWEAFSEGAAAPGAAPGPSATAAGRPPQAVEAAA